MIRTLGCPYYHRAVSLDALSPHVPEIVGLALGGIASASYGAQLVKRLASEHLIQIVAILLAGIGLLMLAEVAFAFQYVALVPTLAPAHFWDRSSRQPR